MKIRKYIISFCVLVIIIAATLSLVPNNNGKDINIVSATTWGNPESRDTSWFNYTSGYSAENPFLIGTPQQLAGLGYLVNRTGVGGDTFQGKFIKLTEDINLHGMQWPTIGGAAVPFMGTFDGGGNTIIMPTTLVAGGTQPSFVGLFGRIEDAIIKNVILDGTITSLNVPTGTSNLGVLVGNAVNSIIDNITNHTTITLNRSSIVRVGGIVGTGINTTIINSRNMASISSSSGSNNSTVGGIAGILEGTITLSNLVNFGRISVAGSSLSHQVAGIVANALGTISATNLANYGEIHYGHNSTMMSATSAGIFGRVSSGYLTNAYNRGNFTGNIWIGVGLISLISGDFIITGAYNISNRTRIASNNMSGASGTRVLPEGVSLHLSHVFSTGDFFSENNIDTHIFRSNTGTTTELGIVNIGGTLLSRMQSSTLDNQWVQGVRGIPSIPTLEITKIQVRLNFISPTATVNMPDDRYVYAGTILSQPAEPSLARHTFLRWGATENATTAFGFDIMIITDTTIFAIWRVDLVQISFNTQGGTPIPNQYILPGTSPTEPAWEDRPTLQRHTFVRWGATPDATTAFSFWITRNADTTVYAVWNLHNVRITFDSAGGSTHGDIYTTSGSIWASDLPTPTKPGYAFQHWLLDSSPIIGSFWLNPRRDITLVAVWQNSFTITFNVRGFGVDTPSIQNIMAFDMVTPPSMPDIGGALFHGWSTSPSWFSRFDFTTQITHDRTLYAFWATRGTDFANIVYLNFQNGESNERFLIWDWMSRPIEPEHPDGLRFRWWSTQPNGAEFNFSHRITSDITLYAVWYTPHNSPARIIMIVGISTIAAITLIGNAIFVTMKLKKRMHKK